LINVKPITAQEKFNFPRANAILARAQALLWVRDCSPYSNETFYIKALEYKEYLTHINLWRILKSLEDIPLFLHMKYRMFGQAVSKYMIVSVCVFVLTALDPPLKRLFCWDFK
jgi:hypothetical protein